MALVQHVGVLQRRGAFTGWVTQGAPFNQTCGRERQCRWATASLFAEWHTDRNRRRLPPPGASKINERRHRSLRAGSWQIRSNFTLNYGLRWEAQIFPEPVVPPSQTVYASLLNESAFPIRRHVAQCEETVSTATRLRVGHLEGRANQCCAPTPESTTRDRTCCRRLVRSRQRRAAVWYRLHSAFGCGGPTNADMAQHRERAAIRWSSNPFASIRVFSKDYANPRIYTVNVSIRAAARERPFGVFRLHAHEGRASDALLSIESRGPVSGIR
jgi:hypothetical protein